MRPAIEFHFTFFFKKKREKNWRSYDHHFFVVRGDHNNKLVMSVVEAYVVSIIVWGDFVTLTSIGCLIKHQTTWHQR